MMSLFRRRRLPALFCTLITGLMVAGCGDQPQTPARSGGKSGGGAAPVLIGQALRRNVPIVIEAIGAVEPIRMTAVRSQVTGTLEKIAFKEGEDVKQGDLLFQIDPRPLRGALQSAEADLQKAKVQQENARSQVQRYQALSTGHMVSKEQFQKMQDEARSADAEVAAAESRVSNAKLQLEFTAIRAPLSGRTGNLNVDEGDLVRANDPGALVTINQVDPIYVTFGVPQQYLSAINRYRAERSLVVRVVPPGINEQPVMGELTFLDNTVDSETGTIRLKATFSNEHQRLWPGQFANVLVTLANPEVLAVASNAVQTSQTGQHVYVVSADHIAELRPVTVERTYQGLSVITKGLNEGETVVIDGQLRVIPGRAVEIKQPVGSAAATSAPPPRSGAEKAKSKENNLKT